MLQHEDGKNWRYSPSKKFVEKLQKVKQKIGPMAAASDQHNIVSNTDSVLLDPKSLFDGGKEELAKKAFMDIGADLDSDALASALKNIGHGAVNLTSTLASHPASTILGGIGLASAGNALRNKIHPDLKLRSMIDPREKTRQAMYPMIAGALPVIANGAFQAYSSRV
jgi:hypothetical protein